MNNRIVLNINRMPDGDNWKILSPLTPLHQSKLIPFAN